MKKSLLALAALSAFATAAQAQSSVTVYGVVDVSYGVNEVENDTPAKSVKTTGLADSANASSRFGVRGTEDLGGGLSAGFNLEAGLNVTNGAAFNKSNGSGASATVATNTQADSAVFGAATRQAFLTLGSKNTGTVLVGYKKQLESDFNDTFMIGTENSFGAEGQETNRIGRANQIGYTLPAFGGLTASVGYTTAVSEFANATQDAVTKVDADILSANLIYKAGNLTVGGHIGSGEVTMGTFVVANTSAQAGYNANGAEAVIGSNSSVGTAAFAANQVNQYDTAGLGASYDFGVAKVAAMWGKRETGVSGASTARELTYGNIGVAVPMGKTTLKASMSNNKEENASGVEQQKNKGYQLQADYALSKRTTAWAIYGSNTKSAPNATDVDSTATRVGLTHSF
jgi:predicted porin